MQSQRSVLSIFDENDNPRHLNVVPRNLSADGVGMLLGMYVPDNTRCTAVLRSVDGTAKCLPGKVARCRLIRRHIHDIGVHFDRPIDPQHFLIAQSDDLRFRAERVDLTTLTGTVLLVEPDAKLRTQFIKHFNGSGVMINCATDGASARAAVAKSPHMVFVNEMLPDMDAYSFAKHVRCDDNPTPIVILCPNPTAELRKRAVEAGAHEILDLGSAPIDYHRACAEFVPIGPPRPTAAPAPEAKKPEEPEAQKPAEAEQHKKAA